MTRDPSIPPRSSGDIKVRAAWLYFVEGLTQEQIARHLNTSRVKIVRMLAAAREEGIVRISIDSKSAAQVAYERRLIETYGLSEAIVVPAPCDSGAVASVVGHAAGAYLCDAVRDGMSIGVGWGSTLHMSLNALGPVAAERISVVSLLGGLTHSRAINPSSVARRIADAFGAECYQLTAPVVVANADIRQQLWQEPGLQELLGRARTIDLALVSVGDISPEATLFAQGILSPAELPELKAAGAIGDVLCHFIDRNGRLVRHRVNDRVMAIGLDILHQIPKVVIAAGGERKVPAIQAALKSTGARVLVTDESAARGLLGDAA